jgi:hypothetical protein
VRRQGAEGADGVVEIVGFRVQLGREERDALGRPIEIAQGARQLDDGSTASQAGEPEVSSQFGPVVGIGRV